MNAKRSRKKYNFISLLFILFPFYLCAMLYHILQFLTPEHPSYDGHFQQPDFDTGLPIIWWTFLNSYILIQDHPSYTGRFQQLDFDSRTPIVWWPFPTAKFWFQNTNPLTSPSNSQILTADRHPPVDTSNSQFWFWNTHPMMHTSKSQILIPEHPSCGCHIQQPDFYSGTPILWWTLRTARFWFRDTHPLLATSNSQILSANTSALVPN